MTRMEEKKLLTYLARRNYAICAAMILVVGSLLCAKCYREITMTRRKMEEGNERLQAKDFAGARAAYQMALDAGGNRLVCLGSIVECDFGLRDDARLIADAELLKREDGGKGRAYYFLGIMHRRNKNFEAAVFELQRADREKFPLAVVAMDNLHKGG